MIVERLLKVALLGSSWVLYLMLFLSVVSLTAMLERWLWFHRRRDDLGALRQRMAQALLAGDLHQAEAILERSPSLEARVVREGLRFAAGGADAVSDAVEAELAQAKSELERGLNLLGTLGNNAPFVGLLGTVLGVIVAFAQLGTSGGNANAMGGVMSGISEALVSTGIGLALALPAVVAYNLIQKRIGEIETAVLSLTRTVTAVLKTRTFDPELLPAASLGAPASPARSADDVASRVLVAAGAEER